MAPAAKRRKVAEIEEISFDKQAREEYLTGFHKRKVQRIKQAQEEASKKEKAEKVKARKLIREQRKADLEKHVNEVNALLKAAHEVEMGAEHDAEDSAASEEPVADEPIAEAHVDDMYVDEDQYASVTVKPMLQSDDSDASESSKSAAVDRKLHSSARETAARSKVKPKKKKKKFRYETKAERKLGKSKLQVKNSLAARARKGL